LETAKILRDGLIRRTSQKRCESLDLPDIVVARLLDEVAHRHVFDHALAQRARVWVRKSLPRDSAC
jgi:hypothetical protein